MLYGIGSCYKELGDYPKAEEYFRRTILKGDNLILLNCAIRNQTYGEMAELYTLMGKPDLANICTSRIESEMRLLDSQNIDAQIDDLFNLADAYDKQGKLDESINCASELTPVFNENIIDIKRIYENMKKQKDDIEKIPSNVIKIIFNNNETQVNLMKEKIKQQMLGIDDEINDNYSSFNIIQDKIKKYFELLEIIINKHRKNLNLITEIEIFFFKWL